VTLNVKNAPARFGKVSSKAFRLPVAHGDGRYYVDEDELKRLEDKGQIWVTYKDNPNGSVANIAGVISENKNVAAMMPHPERAFFDWMGSTDGRDFMWN
jgi:phosphoribosylformylglycinamidine (FGAM) synthase-like amidotransferase family enzyme